MFFGGIFGGGPEDLPLEGVDVEKSKPTVWGVVVYCILSFVAHFFTQDIGGCIAITALGASCYYYNRRSTHFSIMLALTVSMTVLVLSGLISFTLLISTTGQIWLGDFMTKFEFSIYLLDLIVSSIALYDLQSVWHSPTDGPRSFLPRWVDYGTDESGGGSRWLPFSGQGQRLAGQSSE